MNYQNLQSISLISFFVLIFFSLQNCTSARERSIKNWEKHEWKMVKKDKKNTPDWIIYKRKNFETNFVEYKIEGKVNSTPKNCLTVFKNELHYQAKKINNKKYPIYEISNESQDSLLTYVIHKEPFPLKNTEMRIKYKFFIHDDGSTEVKWKEEWTDSLIPTSKKLKRIETFRGTWSFSLDSNGLCKAANTVSFDPKGMPVVLFEPMVTNFLKKGLKNLAVKK